MSFRLKHIPVARHPHPITVIIPGTVITVRVRVVGRRGCCDHWRADKHRGKKNPKPKKTRAEAIPVARKKTRKKVLINKTLFIFFHLLFYYEP
jgi:hypothetical protein